jgi:hypothetical protein
MGQDATANRARADRLTCGDRPPGLSPGAPGRRAAAPRIIAGGEGRCFCGPQPPGTGVNILSAPRQGRGEWREEQATPTPSTDKTATPGWPSLPRKFLLYTRTSRITKSTTARRPFRRGTWSSSERAALSTTSGISGGLAGTSPSAGRRGSSRAAVAAHCSFRFCPGVRAGRPAALTPGYDARHPAERDAATPKRCEMYKLQ